MLSEAEYLPRQMTMIDELAVMTWWGGRRVAKKFLELYLDYPNFAWQVSGFYIRELGNFVHGIRFREMAMGKAVHRMLYQDQHYLQLTSGIRGQQSDNGVCLRS
ncbi:hypothetical protein MLD38_037892 [Melastoma candidum]|uniref:Uncharacterized protein n=1 Tax=Melastoma candidum TaxID=119954 RepID=A0ACB9KYN2_9MYRT|nr:hypothetical protein MLD38_037892 [Melastoma candidum]